MRFLQRPLSGALVMVTRLDPSHGLFNIEGHHVWFFRYWSELYRKNQQSLVVSNGAGNWFPLRTSAPAEILQLTLTRAEV